MPYKKRMERSSPVFLIRFNGGAKKLNQTSVGLELASPMPCGVKKFHSAI